MEAFDLLKKALEHLQDENRRRNIDETVISARKFALKELGLPPTLTEEEIELERVQGGRLDGLVPSWPERIKLSTKHLILDDELRRRKCVAFEALLTKTELFSLSRRLKWRRIANVKKPRRSENAKHRWTVTGKIPVRSAFKAGALSRKCRRRRRRRQTCWADFCTIDEYIPIAADYTH